MLLKSYISLERRDMRDSSNRKIWSLICGVMMVSGPLIVSPLATGSDAQPDVCDASSYWINGTVYLYDGNSAWVYTPIVPSTNCPVYVRWNDTSGTPQQINTMTTREKARWLFISQIPLQLLRIEVMVLHLVAVLRWLTFMLSPLPVTSMSSVET